jgi:hypothetical protein
MATGTKTGSRYVYQHQTFFVMHGHKLNTHYFKDKINKRSRLESLIRNPTIHVPLEFS